MRSFIFSNENFNELPSGGALADASSRAEADLPRRAPGDLPLRRPPQGRQLRGQGPRGEKDRLGPHAGVPHRVERFDRRPIEPFELFTSEFGQNSVRIQENSSRIFRNFLKFEEFATFSKVFSEIPRNFRQNRCKIR